MTSLTPARARNPGARPARSLARRLAHVGLAAGLFVVGACTESGSLELEIEEFTLPNGLHVILQRDSSTPVIATNVWYHAGSAREQPGRTGFAHLFEHIMFEGSKNVPEGKIDEWFEAVGGSPNGSTNQDRTNYFQTFSSNALDLALFIESDRMGYLLDAMSPASVDGQRDVVKNERRQSYDNRPYGLAGQILDEASFPAGHPYQWPVIGYMDDLTAASYQDVVDFFRRYYAPNNASLAISGDFDVAEARGLVEHWFGELARGPAVEPEQVEPPQSAGEDRLVLEDRVQLPRLYLAWVTPPAFSADDAELVALARILTSGKNSRLYKRLVYEMQIADDVSASQSSGKLASQFTITATARAGHTLAELQQVILEELDRLAADPPQATELERVVNQYEVAFLEQMESASARADAMNEYFFHVGRADYFDDDLNRFRSLDPAAVAEAGASYLGDARVVLSVVPIGRVDLAIEQSEPVSAQGLDLSPDARGRPISSDASATSGEVQR